jgi:hypothetical protein
MSTDVNPKQKIRIHALQKALFAFIRENPCASVAKKHLFKTICLISLHFG